MSRQIQTNQQSNNNSSKTNTDGPETLSVLTLEIGSSSKSRTHRVPTAAEKPSTVKTSQIGSPEQE